MKEVKRSALVPSTPEQMHDYIERDAARWSRVVDIKGIERY